MVVVTRQYARKKIIMVNDNAKCVSYIAVMIKDTAEKSYEQNRMEQRREDCRAVFLTVRGIWLCAHRSKCH